MSSAINFNFQAYDNEKKSKPAKIGDSNEEKEPVSKKILIQK